MFLKRLELQGFKSFPEKIRMEFNQGITAVVGPNGSGKSNVSDAVRWVLGEQSVKSLRGSKMEDVIFSGTQNRKPLGFAEVSMIIDNYDKMLNIEYTEVTVTRRVYRSGESEYQINGSPCRLKDIHELFMDTGVGREGYSIIGQGRIDEILSTKSEDRRMLFEEAAGIVKFKLRRFEAENKLEKEKQNLIRIEDIINELESQINPLKIQAEKTKKYLLLSERLKLVEINVFIKEIENIENELSKNQINLKNIDSEILTEENLYSDLENKKQNLKKQLEDNDIEMTEVNNSISDKRSELEQKENDIKILNHEIEFISNTIEKIKKDLVKNNDYKNTKLNEVNLLISKKQAKELELHTKKENFSDITKEFNVISSRLSESQQHIDKYNTEIIEKMNLSAELNNDLTKTAAFLEQLKSRRQQINQELDFANSQINDKDIHLKALIADENNNIEIEKDLNIKNDENNKKLNSTKQSIDDLTNTKSEMLKNIHESNSRFKILSELEKDYEGYYESVKSVLKQKSLNNENFKGICGAVGELINVPERYETAVEIALGAMVQNIITNTEEDAKKAIAYLKSNRKGRATFLPVSSIKSRDLGDRKNEIKSNKCVVGIADELISFSDKYYNVISNLLGRVIIADNIDNAVMLAKKYNYSYKIVTLDGDVINPGGSLTGGSISKKSTGIFSRNREIKELREKIDLLNDDILKLNSDLNVKNQLLFDLENKINQNNNALHEVSLKKSNLNIEIIQTRNYINELCEKVSDYQLELEQLEKQTNQFTEKVSGYDKKIAAVNMDIQEIQNKLNDFQSKIQTDRDVKELQNQEITKIKISINELEFEINSIIADINRLNNDIDRIQHENNILSNENSEKELEKENNNKQIEFINESVKVIKKEYDYFLEVLQELNESKNKINLSVSDIEINLKDKIQKISNLKNEHIRFETKKENLELKNRDLYDSIWESYGLTYVAACKFDKMDLDITSLNKQEKSLKSEIKLLGNINPDAVDEYKNIKDRFEFLTKQRNDIINAEINLKNIISELTLLMEKQFKEQFNVIGDNFKIVFKEMFSGGNAYLKLSDENDILNSGIDIIAQPPGKNLQSMSLLSGGERALTAMALLFAILKMKPSPFCILDEIEAALDDANVNRYAEYIKKLSAGTQFIIITHRKGTMEAADILYGVTMQEHGVSKLVSVKFSNDEIGVV